MATLIKFSDRRTSTDLVFNYLYEEIISMRMSPGMKISETEVGAKFGVSRQPVRDAFSRLENLDLVLIRPQRATEVKRFSSEAIATARFVRAAVEAKVLGCAAEFCDASGAQLLDDQLAQQQAALDKKDHNEFRTLDAKFHQTLCGVGKADFAFEIIARDKAKVDRLCILRETSDERLFQLLNDHKKIAHFVKNNDASRAVEIGMLHLSSTDSIIEKLRGKYADYFSD